MLIQFYNLVSKMKQSTLFLAIIFIGFLFNNVCSAADKTHTEEPNTVDNTASPCDGSASTHKPDCNVDSESIKTPPKTLDEKNGIIISPKKPLNPDISAKQKNKKNSEFK